LRKLLIAAAVAAASLVVAAVALAVTTQHFKMTYSASKPSKATGTLFHTNSEDPANTANNKQPANTKELDIILPKGSKLNTKAMPTCNKSGNLSSYNDCPAKTQVGHLKGGCQGSTTREKACSGKATVRLRFNGSGDLHAKVYAFNGKNSTLILWVNPQGSNPITIHAVVKTGTTPRIIAKVPGICVLAPPGQKFPNCGGSGQAVLNSFDLQIDKLSSKSKGTYLMTPSTCPSSKNWIFKATWKYYNGAPGEAKQSKSKCTS
jgi:hypothetical protein